MSDQNPKTKDVIVNCADGAKRVCTIRRTDDDLHPAAKAVKSDLSIMPSDGQKKMYAALTDPTRFSPPNWLPLSETLFSNNVEKWANIAKTVRVSRATTSAFETTISTEIDSGGADNGLAPQQPPRDTLADSRAFPAFNWSNPIPNGNPQPDEWTPRSVNWRIPNDFPSISPIGTNIHNAAADTHQAASIGSNIHNAAADNGLALRVPTKPKTPESFVSLWQRTAKEIRAKTSSLAAKISKEAQIALTASLFDPQAVKAFFSKNQPTTTPPQRKAHKNICHLPTELHGARRVVKLHANTLTKG